MCKTDIFITLVQQLFDDIIIRNEFSANKHPHTIDGLQLSLTDEFCQFWIDNRRKQLQSISLLVRVGIAGISLAC
jgi:hypothetical protein